MDRLYHMKECLVTKAKEQMNHLDEVCAKELGEVIDMIKDLEEAIYYATITEAMHNKDYPIGVGGGDHPLQMESQDNKEGRSHKSRRMYMESKEMRNDKNVQIQGLEHYMKELSMDVVEMIQGASPEEKQLLKSKLTTLISKIDHA